jgi:hypothetical protein
MSCLPPRPTVDTLAWRSKGVTHVATSVPGSSILNHIDDEALRCDVVLGVDLLEPRLANDKVKGEGVHDGLVLAHVSAILSRLVTGDDVARL